MNGSVNFLLIWYLVVWHLLVVWCLLVDLVSPVNDKLLWIEFPVRLDGIGKHNQYIACMQIEDRISQKWWNVYWALICNDSPAENYNSSANTSLQRMTAFSWIYPSDHHMLRTASWHRLTVETLQGGQDSMTLCVLLVVHGSSLLSVKYFSERFSTIVSCKLLGLLYTFYADQAKLWISIHVMQSCRNNELNKDYGWRVW